MKKTFGSAFVFILTPLLMGWGTEASHKFRIVRGNQKLDLQIGEGQKYLNWDQKNVLTLQCKNIDPRKLCLVAPGLSLLQGTDKNNKSLWQLIPKKESLKSDTLVLHVSAHDAKDKRWKHSFKIPVKE